MAGGGEGGGWGGGGGKRGGGEWREGGREGGKGGGKGGGGGLKATECMQLTTDRQINAWRNEAGRNKAFSRLYYESRSICGRGIVNMAVPNSLGLQLGWVCPPVLTGY